VNYTHERAQSIEVLRQTLVLMGKHPAAFNPHTYTVWYEHATGLNESLSAALDARLGAGVAISGDEINALYESHIRSRETRATDGVGRMLRSLLQEIVVRARSTGTDLARFAESLEVRTQALAGPEPLEQIALRALASVLLGDTQHMRTVTSELVDQMDTNAREVTNLQTRLREAETRALTDALTGLHNRRGFEQNAQGLEAESGSLRGAALLFADIDHFKRINDEYGHGLGDKVLCAVADLIRASIKGRDIAARLGGEEFAVLLPGTTLAGATSLAEQLRASVERGRVRHASGAAIGNVTISIGVANARHGESLDELIQRADAAMYIAKQGGRNQVASAKSD